MLRRGERIAGRFEVVGEPRMVADNLADVWQSRPVRASRDEDAWWQTGTELATGAPVRISPRKHPVLWRRDVAQETIARELMALELPGVVPILHVGPGIVHAAPPAAGPRRTIPTKDVIVCGFMVALTMAHLHAIGCAGLPFGPRHLRVIERDGHWQIAWVLPEVDGLAALESLEDGATAQARPGPVTERIAGDMAAFKRFVASLLPSSETLPPKLLALADARSAAMYFDVILPSGTPDEVYWPTEELPRALSRTSPWSRFADV